MGDPGLMTPRLQKLADGELVKGVAVTPNTKQGARHGEKRLYKFAGAGSSRFVGCHHNSLPNLLRALDERVYHTMQGGALARTIQPKRNITGALSGFRIQLMDHLPTLPPLTDQEFLDRYEGGKRRCYELAMESLYVRPVEAADARMGSFVKFEKGLKTEGCPRLINPRRPRYNCELGKLIAHCEKPLFKAIGQVFGGVTVFKGMDALEQGQAFKDAWDQFDEPVAVGLDASRFDQHVSEPLLEWEHGVWPRMVPGHCRKKLNWLLRLQRRNHGIAVFNEGVVKFLIKGCRMSGDMNTSSGNCLIMCAMVFAFMSELQSQEGVGRYRLANNGDDCVVILEKKDLAAFSARVSSWFTDMGFTMKVEEPVSELEEIEFCQMHPVWTARGWCMVRDPRVAIPKDLHSTCDLRHEKVGRRWMGAVRAGGLALTAGCPVWPSFYRMYPAYNFAVGDSQVLRTLTESGFWRIKGKLQWADLEVGPEHRFSFWAAFGIHPEEQMDMERRFATSELSWSQPTERMLGEEVTLLDVV